MIYVVVSDGIFNDVLYLMILVFDENEFFNVNFDIYYIIVDEG